MKVKQIVFYSVVPTFLPYQQLLGRIYNIFSFFEHHMSGKASSLPTLPSQIKSTNFSAATVNIQSKCFQIS
jgi:hypothetical protein